MGKRARVKSPSPTTERSPSKIIKALDSENGATSSEPPEEGNANLMQESDVTPSSSVDSQPRGPSDVFMQVIGCVV